MSLLDPLEQTQIDLHAAQEAERRAQEEIRRAHRKLDVARLQAAAALRRWEDARGIDGGRWTSQGFPPGEWKDMQ